MSMKFPPLTRVTTISDHHGPVGYILRLEGHFHFMAELPFKFALKVIDDQTMKYVYKEEHDKLADVRRRYQEMLRVIDPRTKTGPKSSFPKPPSAKPLKRIDLDDEVEVKRIPRSAVIHDIPEEEKWTPEWEPPVPPPAILVAPVPVDWFPANAPPELVAATFNTDTDTSNDPLYRQTLVKDPRNYKPKIGSIDKFKNRQVLFDHCQKIPYAQKTETLRRRGWK